MKEPPRLLWVDDQINELQPYVRALKDAEFQVEVAASSDVAMAMAHSDKYDVILVDILMPPPDGIELLRQLRPLQPNARLAALSSYLYLERYRDQIRNLPFPVELIEKDIPNVEAEDFDTRFLTPIRNVLRFGVTKTIDSQEKRLAKRTDENIDPFGIPLADFMKKSILEKDRLVIRARELAAAEIEKAFGEGKIWVLLCGSASQIRATATTPNEILSEDKIMDFARSQQRPPFQFWKPVHVDDVWSHCGDEKTTLHYPTVTLDIKNNQLDLHFDTGSPITFFSYERLVQLGVIRPTTNFGMASRGDSTYWTVALDISVILRSQSGDVSRTVRLRGQAIRDWLEAPFARFCDVICPLLEDKTARQLCLWRIALIGRNLLYENELVLVLDGKNRKTLIGGS
jgi:CheY-like chemotaxis protein